MIVGVIAEESLTTLAIPPVGTYVDPDTIRSPVVSVPGFLLFEGDFNEGDIIYQAYVGDVSNSIYPPLLVDPDVFYGFSKGTSLAIAPGSFVDVDVVYPPLVLSKVLAPQLFIDVDVFGGARKITQGKATINQTVPISPVIDNDIIYAASVGRSGITLITSQSALSTDTELVVYISETTSNTVPLLGSFLAETAAYTAPPLGTLLPHALLDADTFQIPSVLGPIAPALFQDVDAFYSPVSLSRVLPGVVLDSDVFFAPSAGRKLQPGVVIDQDVFIGPAFGQPGSFALYVDAGEFIPAPTVTAQNAELFPSMFTTADAFYAPVVNPALVAPSFSSDDVVFAPVVGFGALRPVVSVVDPEPFYVPVIGDAPHVPSLVVDADAVLAPSMGITQGLLANIVADTDVLYAPAVAQSGFDGTLAVDGPIMPATPQPTVIYIEG